MHGIVFHVLEMWADMAVPGDVPQAYSPGLVPRAISGSETMSAMDPRDKPGGMEVVKRLGLKTTQKGSILDLATNGGVKRRAVDPPIPPGR